MTRTVLAAAFLFPLAFANLQAAAALDDQFGKIAHDYIEGYFVAHPEFATEMGDHRFDDRLTDYSKEGRAKELDRAKASAAALARLGDFSKLSAVNRADARILKDQVDNEIFELAELKEAETNPLIYTRSFADSLYLLVARDFDTPQKRIASLRKRMEAIPEVIEQAKQNLQHPAQIQTQTAIEHLLGAITQVRLGLDPLLNQAPDLKKDFQPLEDRIATALEEYMKWVNLELLPRSNGDFRIGADKFRKKLRFALGSDLSPEEIARRAKDDLPKTQETLFQTALPLYQKFFPNSDQASLGDRTKVIRAVLDKLGADAPNELTLVAEVRKAADEATAFVKERALVTVPDRPLEIVLMPEFRRGQAAAYCDPPGALEKSAKTFYAVAPAPATWPKARQESFYREYNNYMLRELTVHEAMPGHYLQIAHANDFHAPTLVRTVFPSGTFIEGWAVYAEQMMANYGFGGPEVKIQQLKGRLRVDCNALLDQGIHAGKMSEQEAMDLMVKQGFQQPGEAIMKWKRARLTAGQLSTYFVGFSEHSDLFEKAKAKAGDSFDIKAYHDQVLSFGSPPVKCVREAMGF